MQHWRAHQMLLSHRNWHLKLSGDHKIEWIKLARAARGSSPLRVKVAAAFIDRKDDNNSLRFGESVKSWTLCVPVIQYKCSRNLNVYPHLMSTRWRFPFNDWRPFGWMGDGSAATVDDVIFFAHNAWGWKTPEIPGPTCPGLVLNNELLLVTYVRVSQVRDCHACTASCTAS